MIGLDQDRRGDGRRQPEGPVQCLELERADVATEHVATEHASGGERVAMEHPFDEGGAQQLERDDDRDQHAEPLQVESPEAEDAAPEPGARPPISTWAFIAGDSAPARRAA